MQKIYKVDILWTISTVVNQKAASREEAEKKVHEWLETRDLDPVLPPGWELNDYPDEVVCVGEVDGPITNYY